MRLIEVCRLGACLLALGVLSPPAAASESYAQNAEKTMAQSGATSCQPAAWHLLMEAGQAARRGESDQAVGLYRTAANLDPQLLGAWLGLAAEGLPSDPALFFEGLAGASRAVGESWELQRRVASVLIPPIWTATILAATALLLGIGLRHLPRRHHVLKEAFHARLGPWSAGSAATFLCLAPLGVHWGVAAAAATYAGTAHDDLSSRERRLGILALAWIILMPGVWRIASPQLSPVEPTATAWIIDRVQRETPSPELVRTVLETAEGNTSAELAFATGLLHRRLGEDAQAAAAFQRAVAGDRPIAAHATVNLGNLRLWAGDPTGAAQYYEQVLDDPYACLEARYNLAIALSRLHRFEEADERLAEASRLDFERFRSAIGGKGQNASQVLDGILNPGELWKLHERGTPESAPTPPLLRWVLPAGRAEAAPLVLASALLMGGLLGNFLRRRLRVHDCQHCGAPVCRRCVQRVDGHAYCATCASRLGRLTKGESQKVVLRHLLGQEPIRETQVRQWVGFVLPGIGPILHGRAMAGACLSWFVAFGALLVTRAAWPFPPSVATAPMEGWLRGLGVLCMLSAWALSVLMVRRVQRQRSVRSYFEKDVFRAAA